MAEYFEVGHTTLPSRSASNIGEVLLRHRTWRYSEGDQANVTGSFTVDIYSTSNSADISTPFSSGEWTKIKTQYISCVYSLASQENWPSELISWTHSNFDNSSAIAIKVGVPTDSYMHTDSYPVHLYYSTSDFAVLDSGNSMGTFNYLVLDGGLKG